MNKAVIFDLDGTLIDSVHDIKDCVNKTLERHGYKQHGIEEYRTFIGNGARNLIKRSLPENTSEEVIDLLLKEYNDLYTKCGSLKTKLFSGVKETLKVLKDKGYLIGIVTNKPQQTTDEVAKIYLKDFKFDLILGQKDGVKCKPDPTAVLSALKDLNVTPDNSYMVGDGETDYLLSVNADMHHICALWGYRTKEQLQKVGATVFASDFPSILKFINL